MQEKGSNRQQQCHLQQLAATALTPGHQGADGGNACGHKQPAVIEAIHRNRPDHAGDRQPDQSATGSKAFGQGQGGGHQNCEGTDRGSEPDFEPLHQKQQAEGQNGMTDFQSWTLPSHDEQQHGTARQAFQEPGKPYERLWLAADFAEVIEHVVGLGADRLPFAGDQVTTADLDRGDSLFRQLLLDQLTTQCWIRAQIAASFKAAGQDLAAKTAGRWILKLQRTQLKGGGLADLGACQGADQSLAEHSFPCLANGGLPEVQLLRLEGFQPELFGVGQVDRSDARS